MRKIFFFGATLVVSLAMLMTACKNDEVNNNGNSNGNTENPGGGGSEGGWHVYPSTAHVLPNAVTDIDGNSYDAVQIGNQVWMAENLRTTRYADGTTIPMGSTDSLTDPYRYAPNNETSNVASYGYLYNWPAVMHGAISSAANPSGVQGICPTGWHVPSDAEWTQLTDYVSSQNQYVCGEESSYMAKALASTTGWNEDEYENECAVGNNLSTNNATGFSALPAGDYGLGYYGHFGGNAFFWSATESDGYYAYGRYLVYVSAYVNWVSYGKNYGFSVRCVRD